MIIYGIFVSQVLHIYESFALNIVWCSLLSSSIKSSSTTWELCRLMYPRFSFCATVFLCLLAEKSLIGQRLALLFLRWLQYFWWHLINGIENGWGLKVVWGWLYLVLFCWFTCFVTWAFSRFKKFFSSATHQGHVLQNSLPRWWLT